MKPRIHCVLTRWKPGFIASGASRADPHDQLNLSSIALEAASRVSSRQVPEVTPVSSASPGPRLVGSRRAAPGTVVDPGSVVDPVHLSWLKITGSGSSRPPDLWLCHLS